MLKPIQDPTDIHLNFGSVVGIGTQTYLVTNSEEKALFSMFLAWKGELWSEDGTKAKKTFYHAMMALDAFTTWRHTELADYDVVYIDGAPAIELGFSIECIEGFTYRGFLDALLINKKTNQLRVYEGKTTGTWNTSEAMYKNSGQGLGYSIMIDKLAQLLHKDYTSDYEVFYAVYKCADREWESFSFRKSHTQRALWIRNLLRDIQHIIEYGEEEHFPMHGENCMAFGKPCEYFNVCEMKDTTLIRKEPPEQIDPEEKYPYKFSLLEIVNNQMENL